ncbi:hypothetical protein BASA50_002937 [Batrachochytrium salamandrivorans]|uniref:Elongation factor G, mitochondrial n=1 Tax=Batrachochytrium salamandrivorans TaxID=1357716 RepID=A0ABQ8FKF0_9FUNG|nr:hypothetical protein BASA62_000785 [Batrachochytrium salamandrivorans]KAH6587553.1 hypothetical protein BASA61_006279 [Batrachochytrium salamandrivorans]KAH6599595.1 hypothetical protein BASA50_002937 [Batrachochytrium salamandrivorans]KAH9267997.1 translation elongation factor G [Batrachochytrium salamandrivorans]KAJ1344206.1 translation elongation factor G [Batrachochytrium salamandrivorans]
MARGSHLLLRIVAIPGRLGLQSAKHIANSRFGTLNSAVSLISASSRQLSSSSTCAAAVAAQPVEPAKSSHVDPSDLTRVERLRNIGISAHIDSGKTTLTERILFYTGRIDAIHEVRGKDNVGAKMDSMELEREKGITIQSAATYTTWKSNAINIIDTPGHVDFTIEVERALRVLDSAILVLCAVGGVQSQTMTVDRQMKRYNIPRIVFINKMDRAGANYLRVVEQLRKKLHINAVPIQMPIGAEIELKGVVDLVRMKAYINESDNGEIVSVQDIPKDLLEKAQQMRDTLIETLADIDEKIGEIYLNEEIPTTEQLVEAIRRVTLERTFVPVFMGSAYHNKGVQPLLDGVIDYLPAPHQVENHALDTKEQEKQVTLSCASSAPLLALAFKLEEGRFGQLTYMRIYEGTLRRGDFIVNVRTGKRVKAARLVRMHSNEMEDVDAVGSGEICALFGVDCASGDTFSNGSTQLSMTSMFVPDPVISLSITPKGKESANFSKALNRFQREDPTFRSHVDHDSKQTIISGMGELHLEIYVERMKREYGVECITGKPQVAFRETITTKASFDYLHKKQSGGSGQYARIIGYIEPVDQGEDVDVTENADQSEEKKTQSSPVEFENRTVGMNIPYQYIPAVEKGFYEVCRKGSLVGHSVTGVRLVLEDGQAHLVDSSELAFRLATMYAFREAFSKAKGIVLEPIMEVSLISPVEFQGPCIALLNRRKGTIHNSEVRDEYIEVSADVPLNDMFGFSTDLRSITQGKGEFSMVYKDHQPVMPFVQEQLVKDYQIAMGYQTASTTKK